MALGHNFAVGGSLFTMLGLLGTSNDQPITDMPIKKVNLDGSLLSKWLSDDLDLDEPLDSECVFYNNTVNLDSNGCTLFTISRSPASIFQNALERAVRCATKNSVECILSPEIGLSLPVAFVADTTAQHGMLTIVAPQIMAEAGEEYVRVSVPPDGLFESTVMKMNSTLSVDYMDEQKRVRSSVLNGNQAFCVQLLRRAYHHTCWEQLDH